MSQRGSRAMPLLALIAALRVTSSAAVPLEDRNPSPEQAYTARQISVGQVQIWTQAIPTTGDGHTWYRTTSTGSHSWPGASPCFWSDGKLYDGVAPTPTGTPDLPMSFGPTTVQVDPGTLSVSAEPQTSPTTPAAVPTSTTALSQTTSEELQLPPGTVPVLTTSTTVAAPIASPTTFEELPITNPGISAGIAAPAQNEISINSEEPQLPPANPPVVTTSVTAPLPSADSPAAEEPQSPPTTSFNILTLSVTITSTVIETASVPTTEPASSTEETLTTSSLIATESTTAPSQPADSTTTSQSVETIATVSSISSAPSVPDASLTSLTTSAMQTASEVVPTETESIVQTSLQTSGNPSNVPFPTSMVESATTLSLVDTSTLASVQPTTTFTEEAIVASDIFQPLATGSPPAQMSSVADHPVSRLGIQPQEDPLQTNKFYANFFLGSQTAPVYTHPYSIAWVNGVGALQSFGMAISHTTRDQLATGQINEVGAWSFYANPVGIRSLVLSATELGSGTTLTTDSLEEFSVNVNLVANGQSEPTITFPTLQGMGFITALYNDGTPLIQSAVGIANIMYVGNTVGPSTYKYRFELFDQSVWLVYVTPESDEYEVNSFTLLDANNVQGSSGFNGYVQVAKVPSGSADAIAVYDDAAGAYPSAATVAGSATGTTGQYTLTWTNSGVQSQSLLMWAFPHHMESIDSATQQQATDFQLMSPTKGLMTLISAASWTLVEPDMPVSMGFAPWTPSQGSITELSDETIDAINEAGAAELCQDIDNQTNLDSMYFSGKALAKFAGIVYTLHDLAGNRTLALTGLQRLQEAFAVFVNNRQQFPLLYDEAWGGIVSSGSYVTGNSGVDFGSSYYNDHHFHYGYFVYTAAVIGYIDPTWLANSTNTDWVNALVRDYASSGTEDTYFPSSRNFDWFHGHSWAKGLFESPDGKDQESSSEDTMASFALKLWGRTISDTALEARGNLMLAIQQRSLRNYYLYLDGNSVQPEEFIPNKVAGILFENKVDHTTYFGAEPQYVQGIHMLPLLPFSTYTRSEQFVQQEWNTWFSDGRVDEVDSGWRGILMANLAIINPVASYRFFSGMTGEFSMDLLDGGASLTWYLAWSAALGGNGAASAPARRAIEEDYTRQPRHAHLNERNIMDRNAKKQSRRQS